jgi:hypothetical protein
MELLMPHMPHVIAELIEDNRVARVVRIFLRLDHSSIQ